MSDKKQRMIFVKTEGSTEILSVDEEMIQFENGELVNKDELAKFVDEHYDGKWEQYKVVDSENNYARVYQKFQRGRD